MSKHFNAVLIHTCTVQRPTEAQSASGEMIPTFAENETGVWCRLVRRSERLANEQRSEENLHVDMLMVKAAADIQTGDRVTSFAWRSTGESYEAGTYEVKNRLQRNTTGAHHAALELEKVE